jgi:hypothetical protein
MKKYVFELTKEVVERITVEAENYQDADDKIAIGCGDTELVEEFEIDYKLIKEEEEDYVNEDKYQSIQSDNQDYFLQEEEL